MSRKYDERSHLVRGQQRQEPGYETLHSLPTSSSPAPSPTGSDLISPSINSPRHPRSETMQSEYSFGGVSIMGSEASPRDVHELLNNLDRATSLIRSHLQEEQKNEHVPVSRPLIPRWVTGYLLIITFIWQVLNIGFLEVINVIATSNSTQQELQLASNIVMTVFQSIHLLLVFFVSYKLVKKVLHRTASGSLLAQSYLSTVLLFAGLYTLEYRFDAKSFAKVVIEQLSGSTGALSAASVNNESPTLLFLRMLYFSVSTATLCGTSEVEPVSWYSSLTVSVQMLMSFVYFASILSLGVIPRKKPHNESRGRSVTQRLRDWMSRNNTRNS